MPSSAWETAVRLLSRRDRSEAELERRLRERGYPADEVAQALQRCRDYGYLDDVRFARRRAEALTQSGRAVGYRLTWELKKAGIDPALADVVTADQRGTCDELALARDLLARRYPGYDPNNPDPRLQRRVFDFFRRRGFAPGTIRTVLRQPGDANNEDPSYEDL